MTRLDGFNAIAKYYDTIKYLVFGKSMLRSQLHFIEEIPRRGNFLILGGGSGEMLKPTLAASPGCRIVYVEASSEMLHYAKSRISDDHRKSIRFIHGTEDDIPEHMEFQVIITNFFLDLFEDSQALDISKTLKSRMSHDGLWIVTDFVDAGKWWHRVLLRLMYRFFILTCHIEAQHLPDWQRQLRLAGLRETKCKSFYNGFIRTCIFRK